MSTFPTIVLPVFNAAVETEACLERLNSHVPEFWHVNVIDDASDQPEISPLLAQWRSRRPNWRIQRNLENLGFVETCNQAVDSSHAGSDIVLLNSDTLPTPGLFDALHAALASDNRIATVTPWSNNAEICSLPQFCRACPVPDWPDDVAESLGSYRPRYPDIPTGVGFCMMVSSSAIEHLGFFDSDAFPRGYGEENDFCRRAADAGYRNILCDNAYIPHLGGASFGPLGIKPGPDSMSRLLAKHPDYQDIVSAFISVDPLQEDRAFVLRHLSQHGVFLPGAAVSE